MPFTQRLIVPLFRSLCERGGRKGEKVGSRDKNVYFFLGLRRCGLFIFYGKIFLILKLSML